MLRLALRALPRSVSVASRPISSAASIARPTLHRSFLASTPVASGSFVTAQRTYASGGGLTKDAIEERVLDVLRSFEKVDGDKLTSTSAFTSDLGLDSLDAVEVVMAIEEEFAIEIPDAEADEITTVGQAIEYIAKTPEAH